MPEPNWYNSNAHRAFPFLDADLGMPLPEAVVVDFGCVMGLRSQFESDIHSVWLHRVTNSGGLISFEFRSDAPGLSDYSLVFNFSTSDLEYSSQHTEADILSGSSLSSEAASDCSNDPIWEGFMVIGDLSALSLLDGEILEDVGNTTKVEPALIQNLGASFVRSLNLANADRVKADAPEGCGSAAPSEDASFVNARCLIGAVKCKPGYNCSIRQDDRENSLTIGAAVGAGAGEPCVEVPLYDGETSPDGGLLLTGGPTCNQVLKSINGVGGRVIRLFAGSGVRITPGAQEGVLLIDFDLHDLAVCGASSITV